MEGIYNSLAELAVFNEETIFYHGTSSKFFESIRSKIDCNKSVSTKDFGKAFYMTTNFELAKRTARSKANFSGGNPVVLAYNIKKEYFQKNFKILAFKEINFNWLGYIIQNKSKYLNKLKKEFPTEFDDSFDMVYGPLADGIPKYYYYVDKFNSLKKVTEYDKEKLLADISEGYRFPHFDQIAFKNQESINEMLTFIKKICV